jgi:serine protease Do
MDTVIRIGSELDRSATEEHAPYTASDLGDFGEPWPPPADPTRSALRPAEVLPAPRRQRTRSRFVGRVVGVVAVTCLSASMGFIGGRVGSGSDQAATSATRASSVGFEGESMTVASALSAVEASVVSIDTTVTVNRGPFSGQSQGAGTGVVLDGSGYIVTNAHVVDGATSITVTVGDGAERTATLVATDTAHDVAVLHVDDNSGLVTAPLGTSSTLAVGDDVIAIGNALALEGGLTVTQGIVSALGRSIDTESGSLFGLIQTDAAISSGNSGGALVNAAGQVVGINTAVAASYGSVTVSNIGFAIPIDDAVHIANGLIDSQK